MTRLMMMKKKKKRSPPPPIDDLPLDLIVEIVTSIASSSLAPLDDLKSIRRSCKFFRDASNARTVGREMKVKNEWRRHWWDKDGYFTLLGHCAKAGNLEAKFILGLETHFNQRRSEVGIRHLVTAAESGHLVAKYVAGIVQFRKRPTRPLGTKLLNELAVGGDMDASNAVAECRRSGNPVINRCRRAATEAVRMITMKRWRRRRRWSADDMSVPCENENCGWITKGAEVEMNAWLGEDGLQRSFCSQFCRWRHEWRRFLDAV